MSRGRTGNGVRPFSASARESPTGPRFFVMLGGPGAGKGTQAERLSEWLGIPQVSSGDLFRAAIADGTPLGKEVRGYLDSGALVPDAVTVRMIAGRLDQPDARPGAILDGFPRTAPQARALDAMLQRRGARVEAALYVDAPVDELVRRLSGRWICRGPEQHVYHAINRPPLRAGYCDVDGARLHQRPDDRPATIRARLNEQLPPMYEVVDHYADRGTLVAIPGQGDIDEVTAALLAAVEKKPAADVSAAASAAPGRGKR